MQQNIFEGRIIKENINDLYKLGDELGSGSYGIVRIVHKRSYKQKKFALKSIHRDRLNEDIVSLERELDILMSIDHPNIIGFEEMYMDNEYFNFVTQLCMGGDLFGKLAEAKGGRFNERQAAKIVKQILLAVKNLNDNGICHRDLKLENVMVD